MPSKTMSVVALAAIVGAAAAASKPVDPAVEVRRLTVDFEYVGCYVDGDGDGTGPRIMGDLVISKDNMTTEVCANHCAEEFPDSMYFGTQYANECFCGDESTDFEVYFWGTCDKPCGGNKSEMCGGFWAMSVYRYIGPPPSPAPVAAGTTEAPFV